MPKYLYSSTLWYSGIFAAAATFDAGVKKRRREQWEEAIANVKEELGRPAVERQGQTNKVLDGIARHDEPIDFALESSAGREREAALSIIEPLGARSQWRANTGPPLHVHNLPPQSIYAAEKRKSRADKMRWGAKKLARVQISVDLLQLKLFLELQDRGWSEDAAKAVPEHFAQNILTDTAELKRQLALKWKVYREIREAEPSQFDYRRSKDETTYCDFRQDEHGHFHSTAQDLDVSLRRLFKLQTQGHVTTAALLAKISYNLAVSSAPPNTHVYNTLLTGLSQINERKMANNIIASMCQAHMRLNEPSLVAMLEHYTRTDESDKFVKLVARMRGRFGGLGLARDDINITEAGSSRLLRKSDQPWKVIQLPYPTPDVFGAVIAGVLKFADFGTALRICQSMGMDGWGLCMGGFKPLLHDCCQRGDWTSGLAVWRQILALKVKSRKKEGLKWVSERVGLGTYASMLELCSRSGEKEVFDDVWAQAQRAHGTSMNQFVSRMRAGRDATAKRNRVERTGNAQHESVLVNTETSVEVMGSTVVAPLLADVTGNARIVGHEVQAEAAIAPPRELQVVLDGTNQQGMAQELHSNLEGDARPSRTRAEDSRAECLHRKDGECTASSPLLPEQLFGTLPPGSELDEYELWERPMSVYA